MTGEGAFANALQHPRPRVHARRRHHAYGASHGAAALALRPRHPPGFLPARGPRAIVSRSAKLLGVPVDDDAAHEIARRARGTPRIANRLLRRVRDFAEVLGTGHVDLARVKQACERLEVDEAGLDDMDRRYLSVVIEHYDGGPVGVETLAAALAEPRDTLEDVVEPYLVQQGYIGRTLRGRVANRKAYEALGKKAPEQGSPRRRATSCLASWGTLYGVAVGPVLVVDDDTVSRHVLIQALANADLPHVAVGSGTEALAQIEKVQPSLVLLDLVMPPPDGYQILRILRARQETRDLPVVVLTALDADEEIAQAPSRPAPTTSSASRSSRSSSSRASAGSCGSAEPSTRWRRRSRTRSSSSS